MNLKALKDAEKDFLKKYPGGFSHPSMVEVGKKHKLEQIEKFTKESFAKDQFEDADEIVANAAKLVGKSTMVSMFEKPKFRDMTKKLRKPEKEKFSEALYELLHGKEKAGFEMWVDLLARHKLAKWPLATAIQAYYRSKKDVFVKPTTAKLIIECLELNLEYNSKPTWDFYSKYRKSIKEAKSKSNKVLSPNNPCFCGFLMVSLG